MLDLKQMTPEEKERRRNRAYHAACESQYITAANKLSGKMQERALANAKYHADKIAFIDAHPYYSGV